MKRPIRILSVVGLMVSASPSVTAQEWLRGSSLGDHTAVTAPAGLRYETTSGMSLGSSGLSPYISREASMNLGGGISVGTFSSFSSAPGAGLSTAYSSGLGLDALSGPRLGLGGLLNTSPGNASYLRTGGPSTVGGKISMDLGSGLSLHFIGGVTRDPSNQFTLGPRGAFNMTSGGTTSSTVGGGLSMELGSGQSLSISGTVTRNNAGGFGMNPCNGMSIGLCR